MEYVEDSNYWFQLFEIEALFWLICAESDITLNIYYFFIGKTPVLHAATEGHTATIQYLIEKGADPLAALHIAAGHGRFFLFNNRSDWSF